MNATISNLRCPSSSNLSKSEIEALNFLKNDPSITIRKADKGSAIVIMHSRDYAFEALCQLGNSNFYSPLDSPIFPQTASLISDILHRLFINKFISKKQLEFLLPPPEPRPRHFYTLPKIHKNPASWHLPFNIPKGRPIVSGCSSESIGAEKLVDYFLKPLAKIQPSFLRDSMHFKSIISKFNLDNNSLLATMDVQSLYTMIDTTDGLRAIKHFFDAHPDPSRPVNEILKLLEICLTKNDFAFNGNWYIQIKGTAMGKIFAPNYACLFMSRWEEVALNVALQSNFKPNIFLRYIDDIFCIFPSSPNLPFDNFINILNSIDENIQLTAENSLSEINFLDTTVFIDGYCLSTKIYSKPTDTHTLLHKNSFHPPHTFKGILTSQILRYARLSDHKSDFLNSYKILEKSLLNLGYTRNFLRKCKNSALQSLQWPNITNMHILPKGSFACNSNHCRLCNLMIPLNYFKGPSEASGFIICHHLNCASKNLIYGIICNFCDPDTIIYVGKTSTTLRERINNHKSDIRRNTNKPVALHFNSPNHSLNNLAIIGIDHSDNPDKLSEKEISWIKKLKTYSSPGLNSQSDILKFNSIPLISSFHPGLSSFFRDLNSLKEECNISCKFIKAHRRHRTLANILAPTKFSSS